MAVSIDPTIKLSPSKSLVEFLQEQQLDSPPDRVRRLVEGEAEVTIPYLKCSQKLHLNIEIWGSLCPKGTQK